MSRRSAAIERTVRDIERGAAAERRDREAAERATAREAEFEREDREAQRARLRALVGTSDPARRERVDDLHDAIGAERARERAQAVEPAPDVVEMDGGRGDGSGSHVRGSTWADPDDMRHLSEGT